jgi:hypothetical protein
MKTSILRRLASGLTVALLASACTIELGQGNRHDWEPEPDNGAAVGSGGNGAAVGSGGSGGSGGNKTQTSSDGGGPASPDPQNNGSGGNASSATGGLEAPWEDPYCSEAEGTGVAVTSCELLPDDPTCPEVGAGNRAACKRAFELFNAGQTEDLVSCLTNQPTDKLCSSDQVTECLGEMYDEACTMPYVEQVCDSWAQACGDSGEVLDAIQCKWDLNPFSDAGLTELASCMNTHPGDCQSRYDDCLVKVVQVESVTAP